MKKGFGALLGIAMLTTMLLIPATAFAARSTRMAQQASTPHVFASRGSSNNVKKTISKAISTHAAATSNSIYSDLNLAYHGGPVMVGPVMTYAIFWEPTGNVSANYNNLIKQYFNDIGGSPLYQILKQYTDSSNQFSVGSQLGGFWVDSGSYPTNATANTLYDSDIQSEVTHAQQVNSWSSSSNNIFLVFTEKNEGICIDITMASCTPNVASSGSINQSPFCAYHSFIPSNSSIYATIPYAASSSFNSGCTPVAPGAAPTGSSPNGDDADLTINLVSHEQIEAATDPLLNAWFNDLLGDEIGDLCAWTFGPNISQGADVAWNSHGYIVQQEWDNASSDCLLAPTGATHYYQIVNDNSKLVMDVFGGGTTNGAKVIQWPVGNSANQQWVLVPDGPFYQVINRNSGLVLDVYGGGVTAGVNVIQWTNLGGFNQQWYLVPDGNFDQIVNVNSGLVMDVFGGGKTVGVNVIQWPSHNTANQEWSFAPTAAYYTIKNVKSGLVVDVTGGGKNAGAPIIQWPAGQGSLNQQWAIVPDGTSNGTPIYQIQNLNSGLVMDVFGGGKTNGAQAIQWSNHNTANQQWELLPSAASCLSGNVCQIQNLNSSLVLDVFGGGTTQGAKVIQWTNADTTNQQWILTQVS